MLVTLRNTSQITIDLACDVKWNSTIKREFAQARFTIPRNSSAFSSNYISEDGGFLVKIIHPKLGTWLGIADVPTIDSHGATVEATEIGILTTIRTVGTNRVFTGITAGAIVKAAVQDAVSGLSHAFLQTGTFLEAGPHVPQYLFTGQYLSQVLADMMEITGQEWEINLDTGALNWIAPKTTMYQYHISDDGDFVDGTRSGNIHDVTAEVTARGNDGSYRKEAAAGIGYFVRQETIEVDSISPIDLSFNAKATLDQHSVIQQVYKGKLRSSSPGGVDHWSNIREGDIIQCVLPYAGISGNNPVVRVLSREFSDGDNFVNLELQYPAYADRTNAARILNKGVVVREAPTPSELNTPDPCLSESTNSRTTTLSSVTSAIVTDANGITTATATVGITPVLAGCHESYYIRFKKTADSIYAYIPIRATTVNIPGLIPGQAYHFAVATVSKAGKISAYSTDSSSSMANDTVAPATPGAPSVTSGYQSLFVVWSAVADKDISYYNVYRSTSIGGVYAVVGAVKGTYFKDQLAAATTSVLTYYYKIQAVDLSSNSSALSSGTGGTTTIVVSGIGTGQVNGGVGGQINSVSPGIFSTGTFTVGISIGIGGRLNFGTGDYLANDILHFEVSGSSAAKMEFKSGVLTPYSYIAGSAQASGSSLIFNSQYVAGTRFSQLVINALSTVSSFQLYSPFDSNHDARINGTAFSNSATLQMQVTSFISGVQKPSYIQVSGQDTVDNASASIVLENKTVQFMSAQHNRTYFGGRLFPSTQALSLQSLYWIDVNMSRNTIMMGNGSGMELSGILYYGQMNTSPGSAGSSGWVTPNRYAIVADAAGNLWYVPILKTPAWSNV